MSNLMGTQRPRIKIKKICSKSCCLCKILLAITRKDIEGKACQALAISEREKHKVSKTCDKEEKYCTYVFVPYCCTEVCWWSLQQDHAMAGCSNNVVRVSLLKYCSSISIQHTAAVLYRLLQMYKIHSDTIDNCIYKVP